MIDFYSQLRQRMIDVMQNSLKQIRQALGFGVQEFSDIVGLTRQTINNLENKKNRMSAIQYVAICAVIDHYTKDKPEKLNILSSILSANDNVEKDTVFSSLENGSLLKKWFLCFPDESKITGVFYEKDNVIKQEYFYNIANSYKIFIDDTVLCEDHFGDWIKQISDVMNENNNKFLIPLKVVESIQGKMLSSEPIEVEIAQKSLNILMSMQQYNLLEIRGEKADVNVISTFVSVFARFKCVNRLALITQNKKLAKQIISLNNNDIGGFNILVVKFDKEKGLLKWDDDSDNISKNENLVSYGEKEIESSSNLEVKLKGWETIN